MHTNSEFEDTNGQNNECHFQLMSNKCIVIIDTKYGLVNAKVRRLSLKIQVVYIYICVYIYVYVYVCVN
jgi:hypothetical protein